jgi:hypothetical protein
MPAIRPLARAATIFRELLERVRYENYEFFVVQRDDCLYLQASFMAPNYCKQGQLERQYTRQWMLHPDMTPSEFVSTAFKLVLTSVEHEARESFTYRDRAIFGPHYNVDVLHEVCTAPNHEHRSRQAA